MASALDLERVATGMIEAGLIRLDDFVTCSGSLAHVWQRADKVTLAAIARILLERMPPPWLASSVDDGDIRLEYAPVSDMALLAWLGEDLQGLLLDVGRAMAGAQEHALRTAFGAAAELFVVASKLRSGAVVTHVSKISDSFGYDIESNASGVAELIEVKAAVPRTAGVFYLSRNEFEKSILHQQNWVLVQLVFSSSVILTRKVTASHLESSRVLTSDALRSLIPPDTDSFMWVQAARICVPDSAWRPYPLQVDDGFEASLVRW